LHEQINKWTPCASSDTEQPRISILLNFSPVSILSRSVVRRTQCLGYIVSARMMIETWRIGKDLEGSRCVINRVNIPAFAWSDWEKPRDIGQNSQYPGRDSNPSFPEYDSTALLSAREPLLNPPTPTSCPSHRPPETWKKTSDTAPCISATKNTHESSKLHMSYGVYCTLTFGITPIIPLRRSSYTFSNSDTLSSDCVATNISSPQLKGANFLSGGAEFGRIPIYRENTALVY
jgi:hypothetical protein